MLTIGAHTYGDENLKIRGNWNNVTIGKYCSIGENCIIDGGFGHNTKFISTHPFFNRFGVGNQNIIHNGDVVIGNDVWIGENVTIMSGVTIHDGAVIGTGSIVTKCVYPYSINVGVPSDSIRLRFTEFQISQLLKIKWWDFQDEKVLEIAPLLSSDNIIDFIKKYGV